MSDGLLPVGDRKLRAVPGREQRHVPDFLTLLGVTRSGLRELQEHTVGARKVQAGEERKKEGLSGIPVGAFLCEELTELKWNEASPFSDGRCGNRPRLLRRVSCRHRKNAERKSHAAPKSRVEAHSFAERN